MKTLLLGATTSVLGLTVLGLDTANFSLTHAVIGCLVVAAIVAAVLTGGILLGPVALWGGATLKGTVCAVALASLVSGVLAGSVSGLLFGESAAQAKQRKETEAKTERIQSVSHYMDVYFESRKDDATKARDFVCWLVTYDDTQPANPEQRERINAANANTFYDLFHDHIDAWLSLRLAKDPQGREYELRVFTEHPYPGDGTYRRIEAIANQLQVKPRRHEAKWTSAVR